MLVALACLLLAVGPAAASTYSTREARSESFSRTVDLEEDNVFGALAFDDNVDLEDVADIDSTFSRSGSIFRNVDLEDDDVFSILALDGDENDLDDLLGIDEADDNGLDIDEIDDSLDLDDLDDELSIADVDRSFSATRRATQDVTVDRDDVFFALALDLGSGSSGSLFDEDGFFEDDDIADVDSDFASIADVRRSVTESETRNGFFDLDEDDAFLRIALD
ncbi:MAG TPA: hypothetical protein VNZ52_01105 [Candidatus Thermoplasmatota archaeon]|nr:hypothetical protein [Candidatus Thermoplasmatota archaeon]